MTGWRWMTGCAALGCALTARAQVPDLLNAFDAGSHALGAAGGPSSATPDSLGATVNPAALGYVNRRTLTLTRRNLPASRTDLSGTFDDLGRISYLESGKQDIAHVGYAFPATVLFRRLPGSFSVSYSVGGFMDDRAAAPNGSVTQVAPGLGIGNFRENRFAKTDFVEFDYGRTNGTGNLAYGVGLVYARNRARFRQDGIFVDGQSQPITPSPFDLIDRSERTSGIGAIVGATYSPTNLPNLSVGASFRTPIALSGGEGLYERIPGRFVGNVAVRTPGLRRGKDDYAVIGTEIRSYFGGSRSAFFDRTGQTTTGIGVEYGYAAGSAIIPIRVGYLAVPAGGDTFGTRNLLTYGVGYRPANGDFLVDLSFGRGRQGINDFIATLSYRF